MIILRSLRSRAMLGLAVLLLLILGIAVYRAHERRSVDIAMTLAQLKLQADSISTHHADILRNTYNFIDALLTDLDVNRFGAGQTCIDAMAKLLAREPAYDNIGLVTPEGITTCNGRSNPPLDLSPQLFFQQALREAGTVAGEPTLAGGTGNWVLPFARAVRGGSGNVESVLVANIGLANLVDEIARSQLWPDARIGVVNANGIVLAHYPDPKRMTGQNITAEPFFRLMITSGGSGTGEEPGLDGEPRVYAFTRLPETDASPVYAWVSLYKSVVTANADAQFRQAIVLSAVIATFCFTLLWVVWQHQVLQPLSAIMSAARRLSAGDYQARSSVRPGGEFGALAVAFDDMAESLASNAEVLQLNRALRVLSGCAQNVVRAQNEQELLDGVCRTIVDIGSYGYAWIGFAEHDERGSVKIAARHGGVFDDLVNESSPSWKDGTGPSASAIRTGRRHVLQDLAASAAPLQKWHQTALDRGVRAVVALPLHTKGVTFGAVAIFAGKSHVFTEAELSLLDELAEDLTFGILTRRAAIEGQRAGELAEHLAKVDAVTSLPNRVELITHLDKFIRRAGAGQERVAVVSVNVDRLVDVQDAIGIAGVDTVLRQFAERLSDHMAGIHFLARNSADSIAIIAPLAVEEPAAIARVVHNLAETPFEYASIPIDMQTTMGVAVFPEHGNDADTLLRHADIAVRRARAAGVNYHVYAGTGDSENPQNLILLAGLRKAVRENQLVLFYQPKVTTSSLAVVGTEALVRWKHPERGMIPPGVFIPLAERTGIIKPLTYWVIGAALRQLARWQREGNGTRIAVNVSPNNLRDPEFFEHFIALPEKNGAKLEGLDIELTESALMEDPVQSRALLQRLSDLGVRIFIDDFGTGYSSLAYLATLPIHALKIDRSFVIQMGEPRYRTIVESTISMAHSLGMKVVAEGVETHELVGMLTLLGCDEIQGYVYSKPLPADELDSWCVQFGSRHARG